CIVVLPTAPQACLFLCSSRRRHTRSKRDWSSDVCSSDLGENYQLAHITPGEQPPGTLTIELPVVRPDVAVPVIELFLRQSPPGRSEERRVGKGWRTGWSTRQ